MNPLVNALCNIWNLFLIMLLILSIVVIFCLLETVVHSKIEEFKIRRGSKKALKIALNQYKKSVIQQFDELSKDTFNKMK